MVIPIPPPILPLPLTGSASDGFGAGVTGENTFAQGLQIGSGVLGISNTFGVVGEVPGGLGNETQPVAPAGVLGRGGDNGDGVVGNSIGHAGVVGDSIHFDGVVGIAHEPGHAGVAGHNAGGTAGFFEGNVIVTGDLTQQGDITCSGNLNIASGKDVFLSDCAEDFEAGEDVVAEPGTVMVLADDGLLQPSNQAYDKRVTGVISGAGSYRPAIVLDRRHAQGRRVTVALLGKVYCKVDAHYSPVRVGDLLTTSPTAGHAMKACDSRAAFGAVIGKALGTLVSGQGLVPILIALQ